MMYLYLLLNVGAILFPLLYSFHPRLNFYKEWKWFFIANGVVACFFITWDAWFTQRGVWGFNPEYVLGWNIMGLPFEEILFFLCIPFASMFTLHALKRIYPHFRLSIPGRIGITISLFTITISGACFFASHHYTFSAMAFAAILLVAAHFFLKEKLDHFYLMYSIILIPFFIINGMLTGTGIPGEVVWYNSMHIIGIRLSTIPVEDIFYGMALLLSHYLLIEWLEQKSGIMHPEFRITKENKE